MAPVLSPHTISRRLCTVSLAWILLNLAGAMAQNPAQPPLLPQPPPEQKTSPLQIADLQCEVTHNPHGLDTPAPRLSWKLLNSQDKDRGQVQTAYRILVASSTDNLAAGRGDLWDSGRVKSDASIMIPYAGKTLVENQACFWKVQVWDRDSTPTSWSQPAAWTMGLFSNAAWKGRWIRGGSEHQWRDYDLEANFTITKGAASVSFRGSTTGNAYLWQINTANDMAEFKPHIRENGGFRVLKDIPLPQLATADRSKPHDLKITVSGQTIETRVDGKLIDKTTDATFATGGIGIRQSPDETAVFHSILVTDTSGKILYDSDFKKGQNLPPGSHLGPDGLTVTGGDFLLDNPDQSGIREPLFRKEFPVASRPIRRAWLYASALGIYKMSLNGKKVGDQFFAPGWTNYRKRVEYETYDVTALIHPGLNALGAQVTPGWYAGNIGWFGNNHYGDKPAFLAELHVEYADGTSAIVTATDDSWKSSSGPVVAADNLDGEDYDARRERPGWDLPYFDDSAWHGAVLADSDHGSKIVAQIDPPIHVLEKFQACEVSEPKPGTTIFKFPQDINGVARVKITGNAGDTVRIQYAEGLKADGNLDLKNMGPPGITDSRALATDSYTFRQDGSVIFQPEFTWRGYQYVQITGARKKPALEDVVGLSIGTDVPVIGNLQTSNDLINRIFLNMFWSGRDAYMSYPMDCPQRSERLGWTGDANFYLATAAKNFDMDRFYTKWENDLLDSQRGDGLMNNVSPSGWGEAAEGGYGGGWGDAAVCVPYELWRHYGDVRIMENSYPDLAKWIDFLKSHATGFIVPGDLAPAGDWQGESTPNDLCATAYFAYDARLMATMAAALGKTDDAQKYHDLFLKIADAFARKWITADGKVATGSQTAQVLALYVRLIPDALRGAAMKVLADNVESHQRRLTTGFVGTQWLLQTLADGNRPDLAYAILEQEKNPSWGYMVKLGSTTIWESWNAMTPDGRINGGPNSLNHCALGSAGAWMYQAIGAISHPADDVGFKKIMIRPLIGGGLISAHASYECPYGTIKTSWKIDATGLQLLVEVPVNTTAEIHVPATDPSQVTEGGKPISYLRGIQTMPSQDGNAVFNVGAGSYVFSANALH